MAGKINMYTLFVYNIKNKHFNFPTNKYWLNLL